MTFQSGFQIDVNLTSIDRVMAELADSRSAGTGETIKTIMYEELLAKLMS